MADKAIEADPSWEPDTDREYSVLTVFEPLSSMTWAYPVKTYTTETVKAALRIYFQLNGAPGAVVADNHKSFVALGGWLQLQRPLRYREASVGDLKPWLETRASTTRCSSRGAC